MPRPTLLSLALIPLTTACYVDVDPGPDGGGGGGPYNAPPYITYADAGCWWDGPSRDYIWSFEAEAGDPDGVYDVVEVYADVYERGQWLESFDLWPDDYDPYFWYSDWYESSTWLYCGDPGYVVDIIAVDSFGDYDVVSLYPYAYL